MTIRQRDNITYASLIAASIVFLVWVIPTFTPPYPGYGVPTDLLPNVAVGITLALSCLALVKNLLKGARAGEGETPGKGDLAEVNPEEGVHLIHLLSFMVPCALLMPAMQYFGFLPAALVFLGIIQFLCGQRSPVQGVLVAVSAAGLLYLAMRYGLGVPMP